MTGPDLLALCIWTEAQGEPYEGKVAVARVIYNRMAERYFSDGTIAGTVLAFDQFSDFYFTMVDGAYTRVCSNPTQAAVRAATLLTEALASPVWPLCLKATTDGAQGSDFAWGPQGQLLSAEPRALLYCNLAISRPVWATMAAHICRIYAHDFYRA